VSILPVPETEAFDLTGSARLHAQLVSDDKNADEFLTLLVVLCVGAAPQSA
jgi:hypothetical protein